MLRGTLNHSQWAAAADGARKDDGRTRTARDGLTCVAASRIALTLTIPLVVAGLLLLGTTVSADDAWNARDGPVPEGCGKHGAAGVHGHMGGGGRGHALQNP